MLMDIEAGRDNRKEKQPKQKKTNTQKRIISSRIVMFFLLATMVSVLPGAIARKIYSTDISKLDDKLNAIYEKFMASEEFSDSFKAEFTKISQDYANGLIDYEEFDKKIKHLNSVKYAQEVLANSNNTKLKTQVESINQQKQERTKKYGSNVAVNLSLGGVATGSVSLIASTIATMVYTIKECNEEERKKKLLTNLPNGVVTIKSSNHYTSTDRTAVDNENLSK